MSRFYISISIVVLLFVSSCSLFDHEVPVTIDFDNSNRSSLSVRSVANDNLFSIRAAGSSDSSLDIITNAYSGFGSKIGSYTPTEFSLFIQEIVLYKFNDFELCIELDEPLTSESVNNPERHQANFIDDITLTPKNPILSGDYDGMLFFFFSNRAQRLGTNFGDVVNESIVTVTIPGYENVWADQQNYQYPSIKDFSNNSDGSLTFGLTHIQPARYIAGNNPSEFWHFEYFIYRKGIDSAKAILPGAVGHPDTFSTSDPEIAGLANHGTEGTNLSALLLPFNGISIPETATSVNFTVSWDLEGIIEVYDNNTPLIKSDDIVILANNFWERFSLIPNVIN